MPRARKKPAPKIVKPPDIKQEPDRTLLIPNADDALIGRFQRCGQPLVLVYDYKLLVQCFSKQGMTTHQAREFIDTKIARAWNGLGTPAILHRIKDDEDAE